MPFARLPGPGFVPVNDLCGRRFGRFFTKRRLLSPRYLAVANADEFDVSRKPNPHLGFGQGVHYCLGANLARLELRVLFEELLSRFGGVQVVRPVEWTRSNRHTGIRHLVVELREEP